MPRKAPRRHDRQPDEPSFRFDRRLLGLRITNRSGTRSWRQFELDNAILTTLAKNGQKDTLRLLADGQIAMPALRAAEARGQLGSGTIVADMALAERLWGEGGAFARMLPKMGRASASRARYAISQQSLERKAGAWLGPTATVADLVLVDWPALQDGWETSGSDWNRLRAMLSTFCTKLFDDKFHQFRRDLLKKIPRAEEVERVCAIGAPQFWDILSHAPAYVQPAYVVLVATGMRWGEYARCTKRDLQPATLAITVTTPARRKNAKKKARTVHVAEWLWPWMEAGIPAPLAYSWTRKHWQRACAAAGISDVTLHDLRHLQGQLAIEGADITQVADVLGHTQLSTTRRYTRHLHQLKVSEVVGRGLRPAGDAPVPAKVAK